MRDAQLQQIQIGISPPELDIEHALALQQETLQTTLLELCPEHLWHHGSYNAGCPRPILITQDHQLQLEKLHEALTIAIIDIVNRWWTAEEAEFPRRMPLEKREEELLKWLDTQVARGNLAKFSEHLGSWRPDFLVEDYISPKDGRLLKENFCITEINARFSFNGFIHEAYGQKAVDVDLEDAGPGAAGMVSATNPETILRGLFNLFRPELPLHLIKGQEKGIDIHMFVDVVERRFGLKPRIIKPADLRLLADPQSKTGYRLFCISEVQEIDTAVKSPQPATNLQGESLEEIHQVGLELHQREFLALEPELLRQISLRCFNDMRTILLVHDKRMLGIIKAELEDLEARGIVETLLPGSPAMAALLQASKESQQLQHKYILKPIRVGKGDGIVFGEDFSSKDWIEAVERLQVPELLNGSTYVVQRRIVPRTYDLQLKKTGVVDRYPLVGTYHVTNGQLLGLGTWRASADRVVAVSHGGSWICSVIYRD